MAILNIFDNTKVVCFSFTVKCTISSHLYDLNKVTKLQFKKILLSINLTENNQNSRKLETRRK